MKQLEQASSFSVMYRPRKANEPRGSGHGPVRVAELFWVASTLLVSNRLARPHQELALMLHTHFPFT